MKKLTLRLYKDGKREFRWTLTAGNGRKLAHAGESYKRKAGLVRDLALVFSDEIIWRTDVRIDDRTTIKPMLKSVGVAPLIAEGE